MMGDWVRAEMPYSTPRSIESEAPTNGRVAARALVSRLRVTSTWSRPSGRQLRNPGSCCQRRRREWARRGCPHQHVQTDRVNALVAALQLGTEPLGVLERDLLLRIGDPLAAQ